MNKQSTSPLTAAVTIGAAAVVLLSSLRAGDASTAPAFRVTADIVAGTNCSPQMIFAPGDKVVFRAEMDRDGVPFSSAQVAARGFRVVAILRDGTHVKLTPFVHQPSASAQVAELIWSGAWLVPKTHPTGTLPWVVTVTDKHGATTTFTPIGQSSGTTILTITRRSVASRS